MCALGSVVQISGNNHKGPVLKAFKGAFVAQVAEKEREDATRSEEALRQDKQDLAATVEQLQADLEAEHKLNEEMHDILSTFRRQHSGGND